MTSTTTTSGHAVTLPSPTGAAKLAEYARAKAQRKRRERAIEAVLLLAACVSVFTTVGIVYVLLNESVAFFRHVPLWDFLTDTQWTPLFDDAHFGIMVLLAGTVTSSTVALLIAIPLGTIIAIYLSEFAGYKTREIMKPFLELLGGVPTIVYGYFALLFVTPLLQRIYPELPGFNLLSAGIVMGIMIIPYVSLAVRGRDARGADEPARGLLRDGRDPLPDRGRGGRARPHSRASPRPTSWASRAPSARP